MIKQTAGHDQLGDFSPKFAHYNDDVLFGEVWNDPTLSPKTRSIITISTLIGKGITDSSLTYHLQTARTNGVTRDEMASILTHIAFYAGWPNAWAAFSMAKEVYASDATRDAAEQEEHGGFFGMGEPNNGYAQYFTGRSYLKQVSVPGDPLTIHIVTCDPGCRNKLAHSPCRAWRRANPHLRRW